MNPTYFDAVHALVGGGIFGPTNGTLQDYDFKDGQTPPTEEAIQAKLTELKNAEPMRVLREERNRKLAQSDWTQSRDLTLPNDETWKSYRQALRDLPSTANPTLDSDGNLQGVTWPDEPT